jgi:predicted MFS family arabinose efflux permease
MDEITARAPAELVIGWCTVFIIGTDLFAVSPLLPLIAADYRITDAQAGLCVTAFSLSYVVAAPLLGHLADRVGLKRMLCRCLVAFAAANAATGFARSFDWLLLSRLCAGAAAAGVSPSVYALVGALAPPARRATWLSLVVSGLLLSLTLGAPVAALAGAAFGWTSPFAGLAVASLGLAWAHRVSWPVEQNTRPLPEPAGALPAGAVAVRLAPMVAWSTAHYGIYTYLGCGLATLGFSTAQIAGVVGVYGAGAMVGLLLGGRVADRFGSKITAGISLLGLSVALLSLRLLIHAGLLAGVAFGLASGVAQLFFPAQQAGLVNDFHSRRAAVLAWNNSMLFLGVLLGSVIGGQALSRGGLETDLATCAAVALIGWAINATVVPPQPSSKPP